MSITVTGLTETLKRVEDLNSTERGDMREKIELFLLKLAQIGIGRAQFEYSRATNDVPQLSAIQINENTICVRASGKNVLFLEFGTGITYMANYPDDEGFQPIYYAGDWSTSPRGKGHWNDPKGWWYPAENGYHLGKGGYQHTYGNPPVRAMYEAKKEMRDKIDTVIREVFG